MGEEEEGEGGGEGVWCEVMVGRGEAREEEREVLIDCECVRGNQPHWLPRSFFPSHQPACIYGSTEISIETTQTQPLYMYMYIVHNVALLHNYIHVIHTYQPIVWRL